MTTPKRQPVSLRATYWIGNEPNTAVETRLFDESNTEPAVLGLPSGTEPQKPNPGDYSYSGIHDSGLLPPLKEGGNMALLIGCVQKAKEFSDAFLTELIEREKAEDLSKKQHPSGDDDIQHESKKQRKESNNIK